MSDVLLDTDSVARWLSDPAASPPLRETLHDVARYAAMFGLIPAHHLLLDAVGGSCDNPHTVSMDDIRAAHRDIIQCCLDALVGPQDHVRPSQRLRPVGRGITSTTTRFSSLGSL